MEKRRIVITGMGIISPVGNTLAEAWDSILNGRSGIGPITAFDASKFNTQIAGEIKNFDAADYMAAKDLRKNDAFIHYGMAAGQQAVQDAGLDQADALTRERIGVAVGAGIGGIYTIEQTTEKYLRGGPRKISPFFIPGTIANMVAGQLSIKYGFEGPNIAIVTACTTATHNIGEAARMIQYGDADVMIAGGSEFGTSPTAIGGFNSARALSTRNASPGEASRPWDRNRDGFVLSNGAGILVLEELTHAKTRGAKIYAEIAGFGMSGDAYHITSPPENGLGAARCMNIALRDAGLNPEQVDYINAHGTSTPVGDIAESNAIKASFGDAAFQLAVSSTKSMTGHLLGAAGGVEAVFSVLAIRDQVAPPTINLDDLDPACDLDYVPNTARDMQLDIAISNSFGFGGTNGSLVFKRFNG